MTSKERVMAALNFQRPDRIPKFDSFWSEFSDKCFKELNIPRGTDLNEYFNIDTSFQSPKYHLRSFSMKDQMREFILKRLEMERCLSVTEFY